MDVNTRIAYAQVDKIIGLMDEQNQNKIPKKLRILISECKLDNYNFIIDPNTPLNKQNISVKALAILSVLNYNFWCLDNDKKEKIIDKYKNNERISKEKYKTNNIFNHNLSNQKTNVKNKELTVYNKKKSIIEKIIYRIKEILKIDVK